MQNSPIIGVWELNAPDAPFPWHMITFTPFGTVLQTNPPAGNRDESDSGGQGVWRVKPDTKSVDAKFIEYKAHHVTGEFIGKGVVMLRLHVEGDSLSGTAEAFRYDTAGKLVAGPLVSPVTGIRVTL